MNLVTSGMNFTYQSRGKLLDGAVVTSPMTVDEHVISPMFFVDGHVTSPIVVSLYHPYGNLETPYPEMLSEHYPQS